MTANTPSVAGGITAAARYKQLAKDRRPYEDRARTCARVTIPALFPPEGHDGADPLPQPFQSVGSRGVNNLSSKLLLALLPPGSPFFRLALAENLIAELQARGDGDDVRGKIELGLASMEKRIVSALEHGGSRIIVYEALRQLVAAGNVLVHVMKGGRLRYFTLDSYVVVRDGEGNLLELIVKEELDRLTLPDNVRDLAEPAVITDGVVQNPEVELYTRIQRERRGWRVTQEIDGKTVPKAESRYPLDKLPWLPLRYSRKSGEHYGRSYVDEQIGDLQSIDSLAQSLVDFGAAASRVVWLVKPGGTTRVSDITDAVSGDAVEGDKDEVGTLQLEKYGDFKVTLETANVIESRLSAAFLLNSAVQRQAERVTAEEIRYVAQELEQALGGIYSILAQEFQRPLVTLLLAQLTRDREIPPLPEGAVRPEVITGLDALGRTADLIRLDALLRGVTETFGPEAVAEYVNTGAYITRRAAALSIDVKGLIRDEEDVQAARQQKMQAQLVEKLGPEAIRASSQPQTQPQPQQ